MKINGLGLKIRLRTVMCDLVLHEVPDTTNFLDNQFVSQVSVPVREEETPKQSEENQQDSLTKILVTLNDLTCLGLVLQQKKTPLFRPRQQKIPLTL